MPRIDPRVIAHYETHDQTDRLHATATGRLELTRTQHLLRRHLPPAPARVLDVGGGPGIHARWLTDQGYTVHLIDPVPHHLTQAGAHASCTTELGDARRLTAPDNSHDAALLLGPLYHLPDRHDRITALREAQRVVRPGGLIAAAAISRYSLLQDHGTVTSLTDEDVRRRLGTRLASGYQPEPDADPTGLFTAAHFHTGDELLAEATEAGLTDAVLHGIEGPAWAILKGIERHTGESPGDLLAMALEAAHLADPHPATADMSAHMLLLATGG
ncbi:class I SAM-dependent methyltransferase [Streptomyces sp. Isolate_45]|uniref:class I SAM-dependent methyltransferase n=1 Tax=Streptomyces sp. Isolate_45 TaxID=2950111 RepID=UPI002481D8F7|nr:class I SAM-dependent methyltransferase [Streptomyces sp. Isolate_45]MDA5279897.1 class I SAM-dependent methyltransferase [Streptomyces sp. Isolate_45]